MATKFSLLPHAPNSESSRSSFHDELEKESFLESHRQDVVPTPPKRCYLLMIVTALNILSIIVFTILSVRAYTYRYGPLRTDNLPPNQFYGPLYDRYNIQYETVVTNGSLFPEDEKHPRNLARQLPNPEGDAIWKKWGKPRFFPVSGDDIRRFGQDVETAVKLEDKHWGLGDDKYVAVMDVNHQIHCLNTLRKIAYGTYYNRGQLNTTVEGMKEIHANHCINVLLTQLQCTGNLGMITLHWHEADPRPKPMPVMSIKKQCMDWDKFFDWEEHNELDRKKYVDIFGHEETFPEGMSVRVPMNTEYEKIHGIIPLTGP
ncbi:hypothetical protein F5Y16DRAFT_422787 [Xylariaceae sp. FL0255]|nr:hypothetical protein F5Y16DRAFT_422787 [Xylariaceae sp. FL0255]